MAKKLWAGLAGASFASVLVFSGNVAAIADDEYSASGSGAAPVVANPTPSLPSEFSPTPDAAEALDCEWGFGGTPWKVCGLIKDKYYALCPDVWTKGCPLLGYPTNNETPTPDGRGRFSHFDRGSIYWSPETGAHEIHGRIRDKWAELGWERGFLGYPTSGEKPTPDGIGRFQSFQNQSGHIYWSPDTDAHEIHGLIFAKFAEKGYEVGFGYPVTDELPDRRGGRFNTFIKNGWKGGIYYHNGATHSINGAIYKRWGEKDYEAGELGYPTTDEIGGLKDGGAFNRFDNGSIYWSPATGAQWIHGLIQTRWANAGSENSPWGYPTSEEYSYNGGVRQDFQVRKISWYFDNKVDGYYAARYGEVWYNSFNPKYPRFDHLDSDCTNFVSQALHEAGMPIASTVPPIYMDHGQWFYDGPLGRQSNTWSAAGWLWDYLRNPNMYGRVYGEETKVLQAPQDSYVPGGAMPGDLIFYEWNCQGKPGCDYPPGINHVAIVTAVDDGGKKGTLIDQHSDPKHHALWNDTTHRDTQIVHVVHVRQRFNDPDS